MMLQFILTYDVTVQSYLWTFTTTESTTVLPVTSMDNTTDENITISMNVSGISYPQPDVTNQESPGVASEAFDATTEPVLKRRKRDASGLTTDRESGFTSSDSLSGYNTDWTWNMSVTTPAADTPPLYIGLNTSATCLSCSRNVRNLDDDYRK